MLSMMRSLSSQKMMLLCFPISSTMRVLLHRSPISSKCSISKRMMRSIFGWLMDMMRPLPMCLRSSMQKPGACMGLVLFSSVRYIRGREALAQMHSRL